MYPKHYIGLFPPFPRNNRVFVAMSFDEQFNDRWENVLVPAIESQKVDGTSLKPHRVDTKHISDSILTEILGGILNDQLIIADVTATAWIDKRPVRNGNVMYEVGIAHATRLPEEVLLFRSDSGELLFDISNVRVNSYDPDNDHVGACEHVARAIRDALTERDLQRQKVIEVTAKSLDIPSWTVLIKARLDGNGTIQHYPAGNLKNILGNAPMNLAIARLLEMGAIEANFLRHSLKSIEDMKDDSEMFSYKLTAFGSALIEYVNRETIDSWEIWQKLGELVAMLKQAQST